MTEDIIISLDEGGSNSPILTSPKARRVHIVGHPKHLQINAHLASLLCYYSKCQAASQSLIAAIAHSSTQTPPNRKCHSNPITLTNRFIFCTVQGTAAFLHHKSKRLPRRCQDRQDSDPGPMPFISTGL